MNRRGFFKTLAGVIAGLFGVSVPSKKKVWGEDPKDWQLPGQAKIDSPFSRHITLTFFCREDNGEWVKLPDTYNAGELELIGNQWYWKDKAVYIEGTYQ